jgi:hypothetical protein
MAGNAIRGKVSYFGGPGETTASGKPSTAPGIALYNHATLGGWWRVHFPNGKSAVLQQTDIGPAPWTGRLVDVTVGALKEVGYSTGNFPTDSKVTAEYLGKQNPTGVTGAVAAGGKSKGGGGGGLPLASIITEIPSKVFSWVTSLPGSKESNAPGEEFAHKLNKAEEEIVPVHSIVNAGEATASFVGKLTEVSTWIRISEGIGGMILLYLGVSNLTHRTVLSAGAGEVRKGHGIVDAAVGSKIAKAVK